MELEGILKYFPRCLREKIIEVVKGDAYVGFCIEEIRVRINLPLILQFGGNVECVTDIIVSKEDVEFILQCICENSLYSYQSQIASGYVTVAGGHRVGIVGSRGC